MFSSLGWGEIVLLLIVALFVFGPDRLPGIAKDASGALKKVRGFVTGAREQIRDELGDDFADLDLGSLNPREFVRRQLLDDDPPPLTKRSNGAARSGSGRVSTTKPTSATMTDAGAPAVSRPAPPLRTAGETPPYDADAT
ncbi:MAG: twin-arginine translocase TatA/TatE family subunit [Geodermatophilaceae bacterium]|nr:twin-arginine translocase TatA/TatE family subunit [Geodermatophilaceae bacterium]